ncbi:hypothetical protein DV738_g529, partial [Chaetothyriales sp. CBS 135597]
MSSEAPIVLFDLPSRAPRRSWSPNPCKTPYTIPTIKLGDGTYLMDSIAIATELEKRYPSPSVHLDSPVRAKLETIMAGVGQYFAGIYIPLTPERLLTERSQAYWYKTREEWFGMPLSQFAAEKGGQRGWDAVKPYLQEATALLKADPSGPYFLGAEVSYADFIWAGLLLWAQRLGQDVWEKLLETAGPDAELNIKSSVQRAIRAKVLETYPQLEPHMEAIMPKKSQLDLIKLPDRVSLYSLDDRPLFFQHMDDPLIPHLKVVHQYPHAFKTVRIDRGAIRFVMSGATLMVPGLTSPGGRLPEDGGGYAKGEVVAVAAEGKEEVCMIGVLDVSTDEMRAKKKGPAISQGHYLGDGLWKIDLS